MPQAAEEFDLTIRSSLDECHKQNFTYFNNETVSETVVIKVPKNCMFATIALATTSACAATCETERRMVGAFHFLCKNSRR